MELKADNWDRASQIKRFNMMGINFAIEDVEDKALDRQHFIIGELYIKLTTDWPTKSNSKGSDHRPKHE